MTKFLRRWEVDALGLDHYPINKKGIEIIRDPLLNKGTCFSEFEREALCLHGLVPPHQSTEEEQLKRVKENYNRKESDIQKYIFLEALHDRNENLYYRILLENLEEMTPIVYTPTVGQACIEYGRIYRRARGMYIPSGLKGNFAKCINNWPEDEIDIIVVTDGSRILGLGDLGASGIGIPIGKLSLYVACAGIYPCKTLPIVIDVGTNNEKFLNDPLYLGERHPRLTGDEYLDVIDEFIYMAHERWPKALIQFEDFTNDNAFTLLERYRHKLLCFNDDIQGTGGVALAGILGALRITKEKLSDQRIIFLGAGSAAVGIADMIVAGMVEEGMTLQAARDNFWFIDSHGLVTHTRDDKLAPHKLPYARKEKFIKELIDIVKAVKPTILVGVSKQPGSFNEEVIRAMYEYVKKPIIFALSNPTSKSECTPEQAYRWTDGNAIYASGSPFPPVTLHGKTYIPGQGNNMYIFPGVGLGAIASQATKVTNSMFYAAAKALANTVDEDDLAKGKVYPDLMNIREISAKIAAAVCEIAYSESLAWTKCPDDLLEFVREKMYVPSYLPYKAI
jgi:malate dehydrogenase (oxaloacetate-decarboxylating)(NADP+)